MRQVGQVFLILGVFKHLFSETAQPQRKLTGFKEREREQREEAFLLKCWTLLNPLGTREHVELNCLFVFLKLIYNPYQDASKETQTAVIQDLVQLLGEIRKFHAEQEDGTSAEEFKRI